MEDNQAALQVITTGKNPTMRHMGRTQNICVKWLHEVFTPDPAALPATIARLKAELARLERRARGPPANCTIEYCDTKLMAADIFTKAFTSREKWLHAIALIGIGPPGTCRSRPTLEC